MNIDLTKLPSPAELEQFYIPFPDGDPAARIGLQLDFFFRRLGEADLRTRLCDCIEHYLDLAGDRLILYQIAADRQYRRLKPGQRVDMDRVRAQIDPDSRFIFSASADENGIAQPWSISAMSSRITFRDDELGFLIAYLPLSYLETAPPRFFTDLFLSYCDALAVEHAYGGLGWVLPFDVGGRKAAVRLPALAPQALRFCALDLSSPTTASIRCKEGIKSINWLTAVSNRLLDRIGGAPAVARAAGPEIVLHPYRNGTVFQAGSLPQIGDAQQGLIPTAYVALGRALKPLRAAYEEPLLVAPPDYGPVAPGQDPDDAITQRWLGRFDGD